MARAATWLTAEAGFMSAWAGAGTIVVPEPVAVATEQHSGAGEIVSYRTTAQPQSDPIRWPQES